MVAIKEFSLAALVWFGLASQGLALGIDKITNNLELVERGYFDYGARDYAVESRDIEGRASPPSTPKTRPKNEPKISPKKKDPSNIRQQVYQDALAHANQRRQRREYLDLLVRGSPPSTPKAKPKKEPKMSPKKKDPSNIRQQVYQDALAHANHQRRQRREYLDLLARGSPPSTPPQSPKGKKDPKMSPKGNKGTNRADQQRQQNAAHALLHLANGGGHRRREYLEI